MPELEALLRGARDEWPEDLVSPDAFDLLAVAAALGPCRASGLYAECILWERTRTDLVTRLHPTDRDALLDSGAAHGGLAELLALWRRPGSPLGDVRAMDIENDLPGRVDPWFACPLFEPEFLGGVAGVVKRDERRRGRGLPSLAAAVGPAMLKAMWPDVSKAALVQVERCRRELPGWGVFMPGWVRPARGRQRGGGVRVLVTVLRLQLVEYLRRLGWGGDIDEVEHALVTFAGTELTVTVDLTVADEGVRPTLGIYWERHRVAPDDPSVDLTCSRIEQEGWEGNARRWRGLRRWIGDRVGGAPRSLTLKLVLLPGEVSRLKAYVPNFDARAALEQSPRPESEVA